MLLVLQLGDHVVSSRMLLTGPLVQYLQILCYQGVPSNFQGDALEHIVDCNFSGIHINKCEEMGA